MGTKRLPLITFNGETKSAVEWARATGLRATTIHRRVAKGLSPERALDTTPFDYRAPRPFSMQRIKDLLGQRFGRLLVTAFAGVDKHKSMWMTRCDCSTEKIISGNDLLSGRVNSCGCLLRELRPSLGLRHGATIGGKLTPEYRAWMAMITRCTNPRQKCWKYYGGRGIRVCNDWMGPDGFANFLAHVGPRPGPEYTIDRIDPNGNYAPGNVRWATKQTQAKNRRNARFVDINGVRKQVSDWADENGLPRNLVYSRLKRGWRPDYAVTVPANHGTNDERYRNT